MENFKYVHQMLDIQRILSKFIALKLNNVDVYLYVSPNCV